MEWFKIEWNGPYSLEKAHLVKYSNDYGIYAIYTKTGSSSKLIYIGETYSQSFSQRLKQHQKEWLTRVNGALNIHFGQIRLSEGRTISQAKVFDVESALIGAYLPPYNTMSKKGYSGRDILVVNVGKKGLLTPFVCNDKELLAVLKNTMKS